VRQGHDADPSPPSIAEVKQVYFLSPPALRLDGVWWDIFTFLFVTLVMNVILFDKGKYFFE
jgi:Na+-driven multidrug efflux pump